jgi:hypothetical protein
MSFAFSPGLEIPQNMHIYLKISSHYSLGYVPQSHFGQKPVWWLHKGLRRDKRGRRSNVPWCCFRNILFAVDGQQSLEFAVRSL